MDYQTAIKTLELGTNYTQEDIKKNYRRLAMMYHPDKYKGDPGIIVRINEAYSILNGKMVPQMNEAKIFEELNNMFGLINKIRNIRIINIIPINVKFNKLKSEEPINEFVSVLEYLTGFTRKFNKKRECKCEYTYCPACKGLGNIMNTTNIICTTCMGVGSYKNCGKCTNGAINKKVIVKMRKRFDINKIFVINDLLIKFDFDSPNYFFNDSKLIYKCNIPEDDGVIIFTDPYGDPHEIILNNITQGDSYIVHLKDSSTIYLLFT